MGARVRMQTMAASGAWIKGILVSADSASVALVPENAPPLGANQLRVPSASVARFELATGKKRHWLLGLAVGAALGVASASRPDVDPVACEYDYNYECSRGEALASTASAWRPSEPVSGPSSRPTAGRRSRSTRSRRLRRA